MPRARFIRGPYDGETRDIDPGTHRLEIFGTRDEPRSKHVLLGVYVAVRDAGQRDAVADMFWQPQRPEAGDVLKVTTPPPNEVTVARVLSNRSDTEWVVLDTERRRWAVVPRTAGPDNINWYGAPLPPSKED